ADAPPVEVDLHALRLAFLRQPFGVGEARSDQEEGVAVLHELVARARAEQADRPSDEGQVVRKDALAEQRLRNPGSELLRALDDFVRRPACALADQDRDLFPRIEYLRGTLE